MNFIRGQPKEPELFDVDISIFEQTYKIQKRVPFKLTLNFTQLKRPLRHSMNKIRSQLIIEMAKNKKYVTPCYAGTVSGVMMTDGDVYPCELLSSKIGNIRDYDYNFPRLWKSKNALNIAKFIKKSRCFCTHECFLTSNIVFNKNLLMKVIFDKDYVRKNKK